MYNYLSNSSIWFSIFEELKERNPQQRNKIKAYSDILLSKTHIKITNLLLKDEYNFSLPKKVEINKLKTGRKKSVYIFNFQDDFVLKVLNRIIAEKYSYLVSPNCHSFQKNKGAKTAFKSILRDKNINNKFVLKTDLSNFFNSVNVKDFLNDLPSAMHNDKVIFNTLKRLLLNDKCIYKGKVIKEQKGLMAGTATATFLSNILLRDIDYHFENENVTYARYSDDLILFDSEINLNNHYNYLKNEFSKRSLKINFEKTQIFKPQEKWIFLGFSYKNGVIDISEASVNKLKGKIKRLSRRYNRKFIEGKFTKEQTLSYFINKINKKFYGKSGETNNLCWSKWFFPLITTSHSLKVIDKYIQQRLRYSVTGQYAKSNYKKVPYSLLKSLEYKPLNSFYFLFKYDFEIFNKKCQIL